MSGNDDREVEKSHSSNHALGWARHFRNRECTRTWSQSAPGGGRQVTSPKLPVHPSAELADSDDSMSESASQLRFRPIVGVALNSHTLKPVVSPMTAAPPTPVPVGDLEMGHEQHTPAATPHPSNGHNNPANPSVVPILHGERTQVPVDHDIEMSHGDHNPIPATRADILELRQDLKDIGHQLGRFFDILVALLSKDSRSIHPSHNGNDRLTAMDVDGDDGDNADVEDVPPPRPRVEQARKAKAITKHRRTMPYHYQGMFSNMPDSFEVSAHLHQRAGISKLENTARKRAAKRAERKRNLFYRRFEVAANHTDLQRHLGILQDLGVDGMSSDESEHENGVIQYRVLIKSWRNPVLTPWLRTFDAAYRKDRLGPSQSTRGAHPHLRLASQKVDLRAPVIRLPFNAYNYEWLKGLSAFELESLAPQHREYEFLHTPAMMELAQAFDGDHHK
ncbi:hypothetical protein A0H81_13919 [Grifola frondosa]|uniref:Uncharacterized protein n=1 Tax=Grifola frondosa TaxID=5627 RepID=A0A1C7LNC3_GRIFR|nr:hypothetical protein A0H81_13919 [Grifola frondosa]